MPEPNAVQIPSIAEHPTDALSIEQWLEQRNKPAQAEEPASKTTVEESGTSKQEQNRDEHGKFKTQAEEETEEKVPASVQKRIDKAVAKQREAERETERLRQELQSKTGSQPAKETAPEKKSEEAELKPPVKPNISDPKYKGEDGWVLYEADKDDYHAALADYKVKAALAEDRTSREAAQAKTQQEQADKTRIDQWNESDAAAKAAHTDYEETFLSFAEDVKSGKRPSFTPAMVGALMESDGKAELAYHLLKTPEDFELLQKAPSHLIGYTLGKIEAKIAATEKKTAPETRKQVEPNPKPPEPVRGTVSASSGPSEEDSPEEWARKRNAQLRAKGKLY